MKYLVGDTVMDGGERVKITWSDKRTTEAVYKETFGYTHVFVTGDNNEIKLSNRFMKLKDITVTLISQN